MGQKNSYLDKTVPRIFQRNALDLMLWSWVTAQRKIIPSVTIKESIQSFILHMEIPDEDIQLETLQTTFHRMQNEYYDKQKTNNHDT